MNKRLFITLLALLTLLAVQAQITNYDLFICGTQVTSQNASNILGDGAFSYNASTNMLTVQKDVSVENKNIIVNRIDGLTLNIARDVAFDLYGNQLMVYNGTDCSMTVKGDGKLTMTNAEGTAGCFYIQGDATLTIDNMEIEAQGQNIFWGNKSSEKLVLKNSYIHAKCAGGGFGAIFELGGGITFEDCHISIPEDGYVDMTRFMGIVNQDGSIAREVLIETGEAIKTYDLKVLGESVTSLNADDILGDGSFSYDPENNVLTISGGGSYNGTCVYSNIEGLTINVTQDVTLQASLTGLHIEEDATLTGAGKLTIKSESDCCIYAVGATITIDNMNIEVDGKWGIAGYPANEYLIVKGSNIHAISTDGAVCDFNSITIEDCEIIQPVGGAIDNGKIVDSEGNVAKEATIGLVEDYPVKVCGTQVTSANASDVLGDGAFSYDPENKVLSVMGDATSSYTIVSFLSDNMTLSVESDVTLSSSGNVIWDASIIEGPGSLTAVSSGADAIYQNGDMTIRNTTVKAYGTGGIAANPNFLTPCLTIENATVRAYGPTLGGIHDFQSIVLNGCEITTPEGGYVDGGKIVDSEGNLAADVLIEPIDKTYDLMIGQMPVTSANASDILGDGVFTYDADNKVLTINGNFTSGLSIWSQIDGLTVKVTQDATLTTTRPCLLFEANATLTGDGKLTLISNDSGIQLNEATLIIEDLTIETDCLSGIRGMPLDDHLIVRNSTIHAKGSSSAINDLTSITLDGCEITLPEGGYIDGGCIFNSEGYPATDVLIEPIEVVEYGIVICDRQVTSLNAADVWGDGRYSFDAETKTLTISRDDSFFDTKPLLVNQTCDGLIINVPYDVMLSSRYSTFILSENTTITGGATLNLSTSQDCAIFVRNGAQLTIENMTINANGHFNGISGMPDGETLIVRNSNIYAKGSLGAIVDFSSITLDDCNILKPAGGYIDGDKIVDSEGVLATEVTIATLERYALYVNSTQVTNFNAADVLGDGVCSYDAETKTLTISGNLDTADGGAGIQNNAIDGLTIHVATDSEVSGVLNLFANTTITGEGKLTVNAPTGLCAIYITSNTLTIENMTLEASGDWGIAGDPVEENLIVRNSNIHATGVEGAICDFIGITLEDCSITLPEGGFVSEGNIINSEGVVATEVIIVADLVDAIDGLAADRRASDARYNLSGQRVGRDYRGIVIENGKKVLMK